MRFILDENRSPSLALLLTEAGHDAVHVREFQLSSADDDVILEVARSENRILISGDTDFGALLAMRSDVAPSVILFRSRSHRTAIAQFQVLSDCITNFADLLADGSVLVISDEHVRARRLPLLP